MFSRHLRAALCGAIATFTSVGPTFSHEIVGNRFFPATLTIDDPGVNDELSFPTISISKTVTIHRSNNWMSRKNSQSASLTILLSLCAHLVTALCAGRSVHDRRQGFPEFGNDIQISRVSKMPNMSL